MVDRRTAHGRTMFSFFNISLDRRTAQETCSFSTFDYLTVLGRREGICARACNMNLTDQGG